MGAPGAPSAREPMSMESKMLFSSSSASMESKMLFSYSWAPSAHESVSPHAQRGSAQANHHPEVGCPSDAAGCVVRRPPSHATGGQDSLRSVAAWCALPRGYAPSGAADGSGWGGAGEVVAVLDKYVGMRFQAWVSWCFVYPALRRR